MLLVSVNYWPGKTQEDKTMNKLITTILTIGVIFSFSIGSVQAAPSQPGKKITKVEADGTLWVYTFDNGFTATSARTPMKSGDDLKTGAVTVSDYKSCFFCASGWMVAQGKNSAVVYSK
jgi:hypothetical protein